MLYRAVSTGAVIMGVLCNGWESELVVLYRAVSRGAVIMGALCNGSE